MHLARPRAGDTRSSAGLALAGLALSYGESRGDRGAVRRATSSPRSSGSPGSRLAFRLRRDAALEQGVLAVTAILLVLPLIGRLSVLRHGVIVSTLDPDLVRALVICGLAAASAVITAAAARGLVGRFSLSPPWRRSTCGGARAERPKGERDDRDDHEQSRARAEVVADGVRGEIVRAAGVEIAHQLCVVRADHRSRMRPRPRRQSEQGSGHAAPQRGRAAPVEPAPDRRTIPATATGTRNAAPSGKKTRFFEISAGARIQSHARPIASPPARP